MGKSSNFAIVVARLIVDAKDHGIQMFIVQLRDLNTHQPLPGVFCNILPYSHRFVMLSFNEFQVQLPLNSDDLYSIKNY